MMRLFHSRKQKISATDWLVPIAASAVFAVLTWLTIDKSSIWFDEAFGAYMIRFSFTDILYYTGMDVHPPLYYWALKAWSLLFGTSDMALRGMSVMFGMVTIGLGYLLVRKLFGRTPAVYATIVLVFSPMLIRYGQEMRMYTMVTAIALAATYTLVIALERNSKKAWATYGVLLFAGMWTHYLMALVWLAHWAWRAVLTRHKSVTVWRRQFFSREWIGAHVLAIVLFLPWMYWFIKRIIDVQSNGFWIPPFSPITLPNYLSTVLLYQNAENVSPWLTVVMLALIGISIVLVRAVWRSLKTKERQSYLLLVSLAITPVVLLIVISLPPLESSFVDRYIMAAMIASSLLAGVTLALVPKQYKRLTWLAAGLIAISFSVGIATVYREGNYNKVTGQSSHAKQLVELIRQSPNGASDPIITDSAWLYYEAAQYSTSASPVYFINAKIEYRYGSLEMLRRNDIGKIKDMDTFLEQHPTFWYIGRPGERELTAPTGKVVAIGTLRVNDSVTGQPAYEAVRYQVRK